MTGTIVSAPKGLIDHQGIIANDYFNGGYSVISNSGKFGRVIEEPIQSFANGKPIKIIGYPGKKSPNEVVWSARALLNEPYNLFKNNCEHFVRKVHGVKEESPQLFYYSCAIIASLILWLVIKD